MRLSFHVLIFSFLCGVFMRSSFSLGMAEVGTLFALTLVMFALAHARSVRVGLYVSLGLCACALGIVRTEFAYQAHEESLVYAAETMVHGVGVVAAEPDLRDGYTVLWIDTRPDGSAQEVRLRAKVPPYPVYAYGDQVAFHGTAHVPQAFTTDTGRVFAYGDFLMKDGIQYELRAAELEKQGSGHGHLLTTVLLQLKQAWLASVSRLLPEPEASLAGGVIVGAKRGLGEEWLAAFRETGLIHIVVLSGYNLTLVANGIVRATGALPRLAGFGLGTLGVISFAMMTGGGATVVRASIMAILGMLATHVARPYMVLRGLLLAAFLMVLWNPFVLMFDPGFQLSFLATIGLVLGAPLLSRYLAWVPARWQLREIVAATFATQIAVLPLLLYQIGQVSLVAPLVNVLVLPLVAAMMFLGFLAGVVGMVLYPLALPIAWCAHLLFAYTFAVVGVGREFPFASVTLPPIAPLWLVVLYLLLGMWYVWLEKTAQGRAV